MTHPAIAFWLPDIHHDTLFSVAHTALALGVGRNKLHELGIPTQRVGRQNCYRKGDVVAWLAEPGNRRRYIDSRLAQRTEWLRRHGRARQKRNQWGDASLGTADWKAAYEVAENAAKKEWEVVQATSQPSENMDDEEWDKVFQQHQTAYQRYLDVYNAALATELNRRRSEAPKDR